MKALYLKELRSYFTGVMAYAVFALMFLISGIYTYAINISGASASFENTIANVSLWMFIIPVPLLTMRIFAEERRQKTDQLLYSLPLHTTGIVAGKFLAACTVLLIPVCVMGLYPLFLAHYGTINFAACYTTLLMFYLAGAGFIAIGLFMSSLVENQIVAAIMTAVLVFLNYFLPSLSSYVGTSAWLTVVVFLIIGIVIGIFIFIITKNYFVALITAVVINLALMAIYYIKSEILEGLIPDIMNGISLFSRVSTSAQGTFSLTGLLFMFSAIGIFLFLTVQSVEKRRWE